MFAAANGLGSEDALRAFRDDLEKLALATAETVTLLVAERRALAVENSALEHEFACSISQIESIRDAYHKLATVFLNELQRIEEITGTKFEPRDALAAAPNLGERRPRDEERQWPGPFTVHLS